MGAAMIRDRNEIDARLTHALSGRPMMIRELSEASGVSYSAVRRWCYDGLEAGLLSESKIIVTKGRGASATASVYTLVNKPTIDPYEAANLPIVITETSAGRRVTFNGAWNPGGDRLRSGGGQSGRSSLEYL